jgi:hypothetical protein
MPASWHARVAHASRVSSGITLAATFARRTELGGWKFHPKLLLFPICNSVGFLTYKAHAAILRDDDHNRARHRARQPISRTVPRPEFPVLSSYTCQFFESETMAKFAQGMIAKAAASGNFVIVGRGAQCVLRGRKDVFHAFIYSPWEERVSRVRSRLESPKNVGELIRLTDHERASYVQTYYRCDWKDPHLYHMMISSQLGTETAVEMILDAVNGGGRRTDAVRMGDLKTPRNGSFDGSHPVPA